MSAQVIKNIFLSNTDNASMRLHKMFLESCNLYSMLDLPGGVFTGVRVKTVVLFFEKEFYLLYNPSPDFEAGRASCTIDRTFCPLSSYTIIERQSSVT